MIRFGIWCTVVSLGLGSLWARGADLYVAVEGDDAASGRAAQRAGTDGPFASLERARAEVRKLRQADAGRAITVHVRAGTYLVPHVFQLTREDSGSAQAPVTWRGYQNEKPVLIGGRAVAKFETHQGQVLKADLAATGLKGASFRQIIFDGARQTLARYPNFDPNNPYGGGWAYADGKPVPMYAEVPGEDRRTLHYREADARNWAKPAEAEIFVFPRYNWWNNIVRIQSIDGEKRVVKLAGDCSYPIRPGDRYYVRGNFEELDAPGEWYLDKGTSTLYFWPPAPLAGRSVYVPTTRTILEIGSGTSNVIVRGFVFECCEGTAIVLKETNDCLIAGNVVRNVGDYHGSGVSVVGGANNRVTGNDISFTGSHGIAIGGGDRITLTPGNNVAENNYIHHTGVYHKQGVGVALTGCGNRAAHNLIHDGPRMGIMFGGNNLVIEYNRIRHVNLETSDTGAVYTGGRDWLGSRGTVIRYNYFHDILGYGNDNGKWVSPHYAWGVYLDDNTGGVDVVGNIVARCIRGLVHLHNGRDNLIENNILVDGKLQQIECNGWTSQHRYWIDHLPSMIKGYESVINQPAWKGMRNMDLHPSKAVLADNTIMSGNVFQRNILWYREPAAKAFGVRTFSFEANRSDYNLIWAQGGAIKTGQSKVKDVVGENRVGNGGFEQGEAGQFPAGWKWQHKPAGAKAVVDATHAVGKQAFRIEAMTVKDDKGKMQTPTVVSASMPATPGKVYRVRAKVKADRPGIKVALGIQSYVSNVFFWNKESGATAGMDWQVVELACRLPGPGEKGHHAAMKELCVRLDVRAQTGSVWFDEVELHEAVPLDEWQSWQALGMDAHSLVADPRFENPEKDDFRLRPDSPAFKLGFKPIPVEKIGPYASELRASWPIVEAEGAREKPLVSER